MEIIAKKVVKDKKFIELVNVINDAMTGPGKLSMISCIDMVTTENELPANVKDAFMTIRGLTLALNDFDVDTIRRYPNKKFDERYKVFLNNYYCLQTLGFDMREFSDVKKDLDRLNVNKINNLTKKLTNEYNESLDDQLKACIESAKLSNSIVTVEKFDMQKIMTVSKDVYKAKKESMLKQKKKAKEKLKEVMSKLPDKDDVKDFFADIDTRLADTISQRIGNLQEKKMSDEELKEKSQELKDTQNKELASELLEAQKKNEKIDRRVKVLEGTLEKTQKILSMPKNIYHHIRTRISDLKNGYNKIGVDLQTKIDDTIVRSQDDIRRQARENHSIEFDPSLSSRENRANMRAQQRAYNSEVRTQTGKNNINQIKVQFLGGLQKIYELPKTAYRALREKVSELKAGELEVSQGKAL